MASPPMENFLPKSVIELRNYSFSKFVSDLIAGLTVGLVALPLAMAFAISSGTLPEAGLYCAVVAGFLISALGGSRAQIGGPTGAFVVVVAGIVQNHGLNGLYLCTIMAGIMLVILGATGLGSAIKFIPRPIVIGFTNGIAVLIASTQIKDFFGLSIAKSPSEFLPRMQAIAHAWPTLSVTTTLVSAISLLAIVSIARFAKRVPGSIVVLAVGTTAVWALRLPIETIATRFGGIPSGLPHFKAPEFNVATIQSLIVPAVTVTMLGAIESLLSAVVADRMSGDKHNPNVELVAQGLANIASPFFGGLPATGAIARTATNVRSGAKTPVAGMIHALTLLLVLLVAAPLAKHIPLSILAAILVVVAYNMGEWGEVRQILRLSKADIAVWFITFMLTVFADLTIAVEVGMMLAALLYVQKVTATTTVERVTEEYIQEGAPHSLQVNPLPEGVAVYRIHGPFLFGATDKVGIIDEEMDDLPPVVVLRLRNMTAIDATGLQALERLAERLHASNRDVVICGKRSQPARLLDQAEFERVIGRENIVANLAEGIERAKVLLKARDEATKPTPG